MIEGPDHHEANFIDFAILFPHPLRQNPQEEADPSKDEIIAALQSFCDICKYDESGPTEDAIIEAESIIKRLSKE